MPQVLPASPGALRRSALPRPALCSSASHPHALQPHALNPFAHPFALRPLASHPNYAAALAGLVFWMLCNTASAAVAVLLPGRQAAADQPLQLTLLYSDDGTASAAIDVPPTIDVNVSNGDVPPRRLTLQRAADAPPVLHLRQGEYRKVKFSTPWPDALRGAVRIEPIGFDVAPVVVTLNRGPAQNQVVAAQRATAQSNAPAAGSPASASQAAVVASSLGALGESRLSFYEPIFFADGMNGHNTAQFQFSFKYRLLMPKDPNSKRLLDNLYFGYTQTSIWDLSEASKPFRDTSYRPSLFYYVADTGWHSRFFTSMGFQAGLEHQSNGLAGDDSRSINIAFIRPTWRFGNPNDYHLSISPKVYYYLQKSENADIAKYRGYADLQVKYGKPDGLQLATTLRKGTHGWNGSVDSQLTYPLAKFLGSAWGGYLWVGYFNGYGEDILDYNQRHHWIARVGYSISR